MNEARDVDAPRNPVWLSEHLQGDARGETETPSLDRTVERLVSVAEKLCEAVAATHKAVLEIGAVANKVAEATDRAVAGCVESNASMARVTEALVAALEERRGRKARQPSTDTTSGQRTLFGSVETGPGADEEPTHEPGVETHVEPDVEPEVELDVEPEVEPTPEPDVEPAQAVPEVQEPTEPDIAPGEAQPDSEVGDVEIAVGDDEPEADEPEPWTGDLEPGSASEPKPEPDSKETSLELLERRVKEIQADTIRGQVARRLWSRRGRFVEVTTLEKIVGRNPKDVIRDLREAGLPITSRRDHLGVDKHGKVPGGNAYRLDVPDEPDETGEASPSGGELAPAVEVSVAARAEAPSGWKLLIDDMLALLRAKAESGKDWGIVRYEDGLTALAEKHLPGLATSPDALVQVAMNRAKKWGLKIQSAKAARAEAAAEGVTIPAEYAGYRLETPGMRWKDWETPAL